MTLREFLGQCQEIESRGDLNAGLLLCDQLLDEGVRGRFRAEVLRNKALFMIRANGGWTTVAVSYLKEALALTRRHPDERAAVLQLLVTVYALAGSPDLAQSYADQFVALAAEAPREAVHKRSPRIWFSLGYGYEAIGEYGRAAVAYSRSLETVHLDAGKLSAAMVKLNLAQVLQATGRVDEAMRLLEEARPHLNLDRYGSHLLNAEAQCLLVLERYGEARQTCEEALRHTSCTDWVEPHVYYTLARVAIAMGDREEAARYAERALDQAIKNPIARLITRIEALRIELSRKKEVS